MWRTSAPYTSDPQNQSSRGRYTNTRSRSIRKNFHPARFFTSQEVADILHLSNRQLRDWQQRELVFPGGRRKDRAVFSFSDIVCCKAIEKLETAGLTTAKIRELLDSIQGKIVDLDDHLSGRTVSVFEDRVVISRKTHFLVSRTGRPLARIDLDELVEKVEEVITHTFPRRDAEEWLEEGLRHSSSNSSNDLALAAFREALRQNPNLAVAHLQIGKLHYRERNLIDAERSLRLALIRDPYHTEALYSLGRVMEDLGCREEGIRYYEKALETDPLFEAAHYRLGRIYFELQLYEQAHKHWDRYLALDPHSSRSAAVRRYLERMTVTATQE